MNAASPTRLVARAFFDGERLLDDGPYAFHLERGLLVGLAPAPGEPVDVEFLLPPLADCHVHCFLDGSLTDDAARRRHLDGGFDHLLDAARANAALACQCGIGLLRDAGDRHGINDRLRDELRGEPAALKLLSPSFALHRPGRYGSFLARPVGDDRELAPLVRALAAHADQIKVLMTGPIDFLARAVKGAPQFDLAAARTIAEAARQAGKTCFAHANGPEGVATAVATGFNSIEHGYFIDDENLRAMAAADVAWTPTLAPVLAQRELARARGDHRLAQSLDEILKRHAEQVCRAADWGVPLLCGSDAGSPGVPHGAGLLAEMVALLAAGVPAECVLRAATSTPRRRWHEPPALLTPGAPFAAVVLPRSPNADPAALLSARRL